MHGEVSQWGTAELANKLWKHNTIHDVAKIWTKLSSDVHIQDQSQR